MKEITILFEENRDLPNRLLKNVKERKSRIRKFMLYVNGMLNETEKDILELCSLFDQYDSLLEKRELSNNTILQNAVRKKRGDFSGATTSGGRGPTQEYTEEVVIPETAPALDNNLDDNESRRALVIPETCNAECSYLTSAPSEKISSYSKSKSNKSELPELRQPFAPQYTTAKNKMKSIDNLDFKEVEKIERDESTILSLLDNVLKPNNNKHDPHRGPVSKSAISNLSSNQLSIKSADIPKMKNCAQQRVQAAKISRVPESTVNLMTSPALFDNDDSDSSLDDDITQLPSSNDATYLPSGIHLGDVASCHEAIQQPATHDTTQGPPTDDITRGPTTDGTTQGPTTDDITKEPPSDTLLDTSDLIVTKQSKKPVVWPIGYPKPASRGELVVEHASSSGPRKRVRQTRLDGFLARPSAAKSKSKPLITIRGVNAGGDQLKPSLKKFSEKRTEVKTSQIDDDSDDDMAALDICLLNADLVVRKQSDHADFRTPSTVSQSMVNQAPKATNSFDSVPKKKAKYEIGEVVRGRARKQLPSYKCQQCYEYYSTMDLSEEEVQSRLDQVCRHRAVKQPMETPPNYWNMSIATLDD